MKLTEKELRRIAKHVVDLLPDDTGDCERVFKLARELKKWEDESGPPDDEGVAGGGRSGPKVYRADTWRKRA